MLGRQIKPRPIPVNARLEKTPAKRHCRFPIQIPHRLPVPVFLAIRWQLLASLRQPITWVALAAITLTWPTLNIVMGLGLTTASMVPNAALWQIGLVGLLGGCTLAMYRLCKHGWWAQRTTAWRRLPIEVATLFAQGMLFFAFATLPAVAMDSLASWGLALATASLACLHAGLLGSILLAISSPWPPAARALSLPLMGWFLPGWLQGETFWERGVRQAFEIARYFEFPLHGNSPASLWWPALGTLAGLFCCRAALLTLQSPEPCATPS